MFYNLRQSVAARYSDEIDYKKYESQIQKLIDAHIDSDEVKIIIDQVNIFEREEFNEEINKVRGEAAKADTIASRTNKYIQEKMEEDPAFYKKFSEMLKDTIKSYEEHRITEKEYLNKVNEIMENVLSHNDESFPAEIKENDVAKAIFGISKELLQEKKFTNDIQKVALMISLQADKIFRDFKIVNRQNNKDIINKMKINIFDMFYDEVKIRYKLDISLTEIDLFVDKCIGIAKLKY